jgi:sugar lactone lactonase YvrE
MRLAVIAAVSLLAACASAPRGAAAPGPKGKGVDLEPVAASPRQWTGVAATPDGRIFVSFPRWSDDVPVSVAVLDAGRIVPWPDDAWNSWRPGEPGERKFVAVQSVVADAEGKLWVVDTGNPQFRGVVAPGPRLFRFDPASGDLLAAYSFPSDVVPKTGYTNDVRVDLDRQVAFLTDSEDGGLIVLDLDTGDSRKVLRDHPSTRAEPIVLEIEGVKRDKPVNADGIALSPDRKWVYYAALTGHTLYRIPAAALADPKLSDGDLAGRVEKVRTIVATDGMIFDREGNLILGGLEDDSIYRLSPGGRYERLVKSDELKWPDSFAVEADGGVLVTTSQIHLRPADRGPYRLFRIRPPG